MPTTLSYNTRPAINSPSWLNDALLAIHGSSRVRQLFGYILNQQTAYLVLMYYDSCLTFGRILELLGITMNIQRLPNMDVRHVPLRQDVELEQCRVI